MLKPVVRWFLEVQKFFLLITTISTTVLNDTYNTISIGIPAIDNLSVTDRCTSVTASWDEGPCRDLSYNVTLSSSDGVILGPFTTNNTNYTFTDVDTINGIITIDIFDFNTNARGDVVTETAVIDKFPNATCMFAYVCILVFICLCVCMCVYKCIPTYVHTMYL